MLESVEGSWGCRGRGRIQVKTVELKYHVRGGVRAAESTLGWRCRLGVISLEMVIEVRSTGGHAREISQSVMVFSTGGTCVPHGDTCNVWRHFWLLQW